MERVLESHRQELELPTANAGPRLAPEASAAFPKPQTAAQRMQGGRRCRRLDVITPLNCFASSAPAAIAEVDK